MKKINYNIDHSCIVPLERAIDVNGLSFENSWVYEINDAYVLRGPTFELATKSAQELALLVTEFDSFNLKEVNPECYEKIDIKNILVPEKYKHLDWLNRIRIMSHRLEYADVARILNHMVAWFYCTTKGTPTIILESNARLLSKPHSHFPRSSIIGLDTKGKLHKHNNNYQVMPGVWAYSVDQFSSKRLFDSVMSNGMKEPLELMFCAHQRLILLEERAYKEQQ